MSADILDVRQNERDALLAGIVSTLEADSRVVAAWLTGSLARGSADAFSDIDVMVVVADAYIEVVKEGRQQYVASVGEPVLIEEAPQNAPPGGAYLLVLYSGEAGPQQVDWYWQAQSAAVIPSDASLLFDHVGLPHATPPAELSREERTRAARHEIAFFWAMVNICAKKIARRESWTVLDILNTVWHTLEQIKWQAGVRPTKPTHRDAPNDRPPVHPNDQLALLRHISAEMESLSPQLAQLGVSAPKAAITHINQFLANVAEN